MLDCERPRFAPGLFFFWETTMTIDTSEVFTVELHPHSPLWAEMAAEETTRLKQALGRELVAVHHIGSTAIPGILAKPVVDLIPIVADIERLDAREKGLRALRVSSVREC